VTRGEGRCTVLVLDGVEEREQELRGLGRRNSTGFRGEKRRKFYARG